MIELVFRPEARPEIVIGAPAVGADAEPLRWTSAATYLERAPAASSNASTMDRLRTRLPSRSWISIRVGPAGRGGEEAQLLSALAQLLVDPAGGGDLVEHLLRWCAPGGDGREHRFAGRQLGHERAEVGRIAAGGRGRCRTGLQGPEWA